MKKLDILLKPKLHIWYNTLCKTCLAQLIAYVAFIFICFSGFIDKKEQKMNVENGAKER
jgi:hypothetical protein